MEITAVQSGEGSREHSNGRNVHFDNFKVSVEKDYQMKAIQNLPSRKKKRVSTPTDFSLEKQLKTKAKREATRT